MVQEVPVSGKVIYPEDKIKMIEAVMDGWFTEGRFCKEFSDKLKSYIGVKHCSLVNSGSSANLLAVLALADEYAKYDYRKKIITCATGFPTTVYPIIQAGYIPLFVDADPDTLNARMDDVMRKLSDPTVMGVILAHTLGFPYDAKKLREECDRLEKFLIEDCCDALGAELYGQKVGSFGHASTYSFYPAHHITTGEGGAILTDEGRLMKTINSYRDWGRDCWCLPGKDNTCNKRFSWEWDDLPEGWDHKYTYTKLGYNMKMTEMQAALGSSQIDRIENFCIDRRENFFYLSDHIQPNFLGFYDPRFRVPPIGTFSPFGFSITIENNKFFVREELVGFLEKHNVRTRPVFAGNITRQPVFKDIEYEVFGDLSGSDYIMNNSFWIGCWHGLTNEHLGYVIEVFDEFFRSKGLK